MNSKHLKAAAKSAVFVTVLSYAVGLRAATPSTVQTSGGSVVIRNHLQTVAFTDTAEAGMLRRAYAILATGDHDYKGHRVKAMRQIEAAAGLLGMKLGGDVKNRQPQALSDAKLREVQGLLQNVLNSSEVKRQKRVSKHLSDAIHQLGVALSIR